MGATNRYRAEPGLGSVKSRQKGVRRIVISMDEETFAQVRARAVAAETSFADAARELIEWGLMEAEDRE